MTLARFLLVVLAVGYAGVAVANPIGVTVDAPDSVTPGEEATITYELTNEGSDPTSALGFELQPLPANVTVTEINTETGTVAADQNAVFWVDPVEPGVTVTVSLAIAFDASAPAGTRTVEAEIHSNETVTAETTRIAVETADNDDDENGQTGDIGGDDGQRRQADDVGPLALSPELLVAGGVFGVALLYLSYRRLGSNSA